MLEHGVFPDDFTFRNGITTVVDAGSSGWRTFPEFKEHIVDHAKTRVFAMLNIVGAGMIGGAAEQNLSDMDGEATAAVALKYPDVIVGIKSAHFNGPEWLPYEQSVKAGTIAHVPVMIDYGARRPERPLSELLERVLRPGDIYTHMYSGHRGEQDAQTLGPGKGMKEGRARGIIFDVGNGSGSFSWAVAVPLVIAGFLPDSISTDLHVHSMNSDMKDLLNVGDKFLALGLPLKDVIADMTWHPAREIHHPELGNLSVGSPADVAVLSLQHGNFGLQDMYNTVLVGHDRIFCELTVRNGKLVYDLNGLSSEPWDGKPSDSARQSRRWTTLNGRNFGAAARPTSSTSGNPTPSQH
jgi:dihydroorotase